eukprot:TRINITY_DN54477_c0_g1_i1.p1 TRINITY_DN54477_c0_g1~~TRINITY_DN54477_c0_g1_i1.p1  ORF type:complete len:112 (-),score=22.09 TRINITY_DN54477_c0_g1_i1:19-354(-)
MVASQHGAGVTAFLDTIQSPPVLGGGARPVMCYPDPKAGAGPNGGVPFRCYGMAMLNDAAEAVKGMNLPSVRKRDPFADADPLQGAMQLLLVPELPQQAMQRHRRTVAQFL